MPKKVRVEKSEPRIVKNTGERASPGPGRFPSHATTSTTTTSFASVPAWFGDPTRTDLRAVLREDLRELPMRAPLEPVQPDTAVAKRPKGRRKTPKIDTA